MLFYDILALIVMSHSVLSLCSVPKNFTKATQLIESGEESAVNSFFVQTLCEVRSNIASFRHCYETCNQHEACNGFTQVQSECWTCNTASSGGQAVPEGSRSSFYIVLVNLPDTGCKTTVQGAEYTGYLTITAAGNECQRWDSQSPHTHCNSNINSYPDTGTLADVANFCRNPDGSPFGPWCYTTNPNTRWEYCNVPFCEGLETAHCRTTASGMEYHGTNAVTQGGITCQRWDQQTPHSHSRTNIQKFPEIYDISNVHNYCRNPDHDSAPWCYTTDPGVRYDYCDVPYC